MQISESRSQRVVSVRFGPALLVLAALALGFPCAGEAAQSCSDLVAPEDMEMVSSAAEVPGVYIARLNAGDAERVTDLFADDGVHRGPDGQIRRGRAAILAFYEGVLADGPRGLAVGKSVADSGRVAFELINVEGCNDEDPATAVDLIDVNDANQIQDFTVFFRPSGR